MVEPLASLRIVNLRFSYKGREALAGLDFSVERGELFGLVGPNGSGKSTLLRIISTALPCPAGCVAVDGFDPARDGDAVRRRIGVAFQSPSLDLKLSVEENIRCQGYLFGLRGKDLSRRIDSLLERFQLGQRRRERVETLSGGLRRRVELAKTLLHRPSLLLLDEPSTGLDPAARQEFWNTVEALRQDQAPTILVATHLMDEAEKCGRVALMDEGRLVALDTPGALKQELGGEVLTLESANPEKLAAGLVERMGLPAEAIDGVVRLALDSGRSSLPRILQTFQREIDGLHVTKPTLHDVFIARTGHRLADREAGKS